jgi:uncharacterized protein
MSNSTENSGQRPQHVHAHALAESASTPGLRRASVSKRIWIDLDNTPHVPFFVPIIRELQREGHSVIVTARDAFQVCSLADYHSLDYCKVGRHYGANRAMKVAGTVWRAAQLLLFVRRRRPDISISHGSRPLVLASSALRIPTMLLFDYEHAMRLPFVKPAIGVAPDSIDDPELAKGFRYGLRTYGGLKEDVYAGALRPDPSILAELGVRKDEILVTIRPPANEAHYHNPEAERLLVETVNFLGGEAGVRMVILPRTAGAQGEFVHRTWPRWCEERKIIIPKGPLDGLNLVWFSDLVVSGGGTMNREAAALGVPVYSIFRGKLGAVDRRLAREGRLILIQKPEDIWMKLSPVKRARSTKPVPTERPAFREILNAAYELIELSNRRQ